MALTIEILNKKHIKSDFDCGYPMLDNYLKSQASQDLRRDISVCYVICENDDDLVLGYYTLSSHSIPLESLPETLKHKLPKSYSNIPSALLGRLAVAKSFQGKQIGKILLIDALNRCADLSASIGTLAVIVDPIDHNAFRFYEAFGFINLPDSGRMFIPVQTIIASRE